MAHNRPITLKIAEPGAFSGIYRAFAVLLILAAILSPHPLIMLLLSCCLLAFSPHIGRQLTFANQSRASSLVLYPDANISLVENGLPLSGGSLGTQHWVTQRLSVLAVVIGGRTHRLVLLANQQNADDYRRVKVWIQHRFAVKDE